MIDDALMAEFGHNRFVQLWLTPGVFLLRRPDFNNLSAEIVVRYGGIYEQVGCFFSLCGRV